jgi:N-acyl-D-aspartate/D-glutamate deacylase
MYDLIIKKGLIVDGTNCPGRKGDVGIKKDRIVFIGELPCDQGKKFSLPKVKLLLLVLLTSTPILISLSLLIRERRVKFARE